MDAEDQSFTIVDDVGWTVASGYMNPDLVPFVRFNNPAQILRDTEAHLKILELTQRLKELDQPDDWMRRARVIDDLVATVAGIYPEVTEQ